MVKLQNQTKGNSLPVLVLMVLVVLPTAYFLLASVSSQAEAMQEEKFFKDLGNLKETVAELAQSPGFARRALTVVVPRGIQSAMVFGSTVQIEYVDRPGVRYYDFGYPVSLKADFTVPGRMETLVEKRGGAVMVCDRECICTAQEENCNDFLDDDCDLMVDACDSDCGPVTEEYCWI